MMLRQRGLEQASAPASHPAISKDRWHSPRRNGLIGGMADEIQTVIPHLKFGTPECSGFLFGRIGLDIAVIACNACGKIVRSVAAGDLQRTLHEMELQLEVATALCRHCRAVSLFPGFSRVEVFVCQTCGRTTLNQPF
jgi:hypothetical protein